MNRIRFIRMEQVFPSGSCLGEIRSDIKTLIYLCSSVDVFAIK